MSGVPKWTDIELAAAVLTELYRQTTRKLEERARVRQEAIRRAHERQLAQAKAEELRLLIGARDAATGDGPDRAREAADRLAGATSETEVRQAIAYSRFMRARLAQSGMEDHTKESEAFAEQVRAQLRMSDEEAYLDELARDPVVSTWLSTEIPLVRQELTGLAPLVERRNWNELHHSIDALHQTMESKLAWAAEQQRKADQRDYVATKMRECLAEIGLSQVSLPEKEHPYHPMSATVISASVEPGRALQVSVPFRDAGNEKVLYTVGGFDVHEVFSVDGEGSECPDAQALLERLHQALAGQGIATNGLHWEKQPPPLQNGMAKGLPRTREDEHGTNP